MFLAPLGKSKKEVEGEVNNGRFPPCILYKIIYTSPAKNRVNHAMMKVALHGANVPLVFCCIVKEEMSKCVCIQCTYVIVFVILIHV